MDRLLGLKPGPAKRERSTLSTTSPPTASNSLLNDRNFTADYGRLEPVSPLIRRIVAPQPGPFTFLGTGTYVVGHGKVAVIDPGPDLADHVAALLTGSRRRDRQPYPGDPYPSRPFAGGGRPAGRDRRADFWLRSPRPVGETGEAGADLAFTPDHRLRDGEASRARAGGSRRCIRPATPPTISASRSPQERALFSGDHVMGWSTTVIAPPDGDMAAYMRSLAKLRQRDDKVYWPTHGGPIRDPKTHVAALTEHRLARRHAVLAALSARPATPAALVGPVYPGLDPRLTGAAALSLLAHLIELAAAGLAGETDGSWYRRG